MVHRRAATVVALVGSNPLPVLLACQALGADHVVLLPTDQTRHRAQALEASFKADGARVTIKQLTSASEALKIAADVLGAVEAAGDPGVHLHYTGGTKAMAVAAAVALIEKVPSGRRSYLDDVSRRLVFDDGYAVDLPPEHLDLGEVLRLHGWSQGTSGHSDPIAFDAEELVRTLVRDLASGGDRVRALRCDLRPGGQLVAKGADVPRGLRLDGLGVPLDYLTKVASGTLSNAEAKRLGRYLTGDWLEEWVGRLLHAVTGVQAVVSVTTKEPEFEVDVVSGAGGRLRIISCTTDDTQSLVKGKAFEVAFRGRQFGDQTLTAVVSALPGDKGNAVSRVLASGWDSRVATEIFSVDDLVAWQAGDLSSLRAWIERTR